MDNSKNDVENESKNDTVITVDSESKSNADNVDSVRSQMLDVAESIVNAPGKIGKSVSLIASRVFDSMKYNLNFGSGGISSMQPPFSIDPSVAKYLREASSMSGVEYSRSSVQMSPPVLSVRVLSLNGPVVHDPNIYHPVVRVHVVDATTGRYLRVINPVRAPDVDPSQTMGGRYRSPSVANVQCSCFGPSYSAEDQRTQRLMGPLSTPSAEPRVTLPALNRTLYTDAEQLRKSGVSEYVLPAGQSDALGSHDSSLLWAESLVFSVPLEEALQPNVMLLFEVVEHSRVMPTFLSREKDSIDSSMEADLRARANDVSDPGTAESVEVDHVPIMWGFLRLLDGDGMPLPCVDSRVPLGIPRTLGPQLRAQSASAPALLSALPALEVQMFEMLPPDWADKIVHSTSLPLTKPQPLGTAPAGQLANVRELESPPVFLQTRMRARRPKEGFSLRVNVFGAVIPAVRFVERTEVGTTCYSYPLWTSSSPQDQSDNQSKPPSKNPPALDAEEDFSVGVVGDTFRDNRSRGSVPLPAASQAVNSSNPSSAGRLSRPIVLSDKLRTVHPLLNRHPLRIVLPTDTRPPERPSVLSAPVDEPQPQQTDPEAPFGRPLRLGAPCEPPICVVGTLPTASQGASSTAFSPDGFCVAVATLARNQHSVRVFEVGRGAELCTLHPASLMNIPKVVASKDKAMSFGLDAVVGTHGGGMIYSMEWSSCGTRLLTCSSDGLAVVWQIKRKGKYLNSMAQPARPLSVMIHVPPTYVYAARFHPLDAGVVVTGAYDGHIRVWDTHLGPSRVNSSLSTDGSVAHSTVNEVSLTEGNSEVTIATLLFTLVSDSNASAGASREAGREFSMSELIPTSVASVGGSTNGSGQGNMDSESNVLSLTQSNRNVPSMPPKTAPAHPGYVSCLEFVSKTTLLSSDELGNIYSWSLNQVPILRTSRDESSGHRNATSQVSLASTGMLESLSSPSNEAEYFYDPRDRRNYLFENSSRRNVGAAIVSMRAHPFRSEMCVLTQSSRLLCFEWVNMSVIREFRGANCVTSRIDISYSPDGRFIASGAEDGQLRVWDARTGVLAATETKSEGGEIVKVGYPRQMLSVSWSSSLHMVAVAAFGLEYPVMLCS